MEATTAAAIWGAIGSLFGTFVGAWASIRTTNENNDHAAEQRRIDLREARSEQRRTFQRETLLQLQDAVHPYVELFSQTLGGVAPHEKNLEYMSSGVQVMKLAQRLTDEPLRGLVIAFLDDTATTHQSCMPGSPQDYMSAVLVDTAKRHNDLGKAIGEVLRTQL